MCQMAWAQKCCTEFFLCSLSASSNLFHFFKDIMVNNSQSGSKLIANCKQPDTFEASGLCTVVFMVWRHILAEKCCCHSSITKVPRFAPLGALLSDLEYFQRRPIKALYDTVVIQKEAVSQGKSCLRTRQVNVLSKKTKAKHHSFVHPDSVL